MVYKSSDNIPMLQILEKADRAGLAYTAETESYSTNQEE